MPTLDGPEGLFWSGPPPILSGAGVPIGRRPPAGKLFAHLICPNPLLSTMAQLCSFSIGDNVKGLPTWSHAEVIDALQAAFPRGFTAWEASGAWLGGMEATTVCQVLDIDAKSAKASQKLLEFAFRQEKVLCTIQEVTEL